MMLELGIIPVRFVIMQKRMQFLQYILQESTDSMLSRVFQTLKEDSTKGDFVALTNKDKLDLEITFTDIDIKNMSKRRWKRIVKEKTHIVSLKYLFF